MSGNILEANAEALVNTVNCAGAMGKGIALQFKQAYPENYHAYYRAFKCGELQIGRMFVYDRGDTAQPRYIINFPTKKHWRTKSKLDYIKAGLTALVAEVEQRHISSIAVPPLGCGNGGLNWNEVRPLIEQAFAPLSNVHTLIYEPDGAPDAIVMPIATSRPKMTPARAVLLLLLERYAEPMAHIYRLSMIEVQKLAYFAQAAGESLNIQFVKHKYGPYAEVIHKMLQRMEGHFIRGYGDRSREASIYLLPNAAAEARAVLLQYPDSLVRLERVADLIQGFETPYSMELIATVHWVAQQEISDGSPELDKVISGVHDWNERKALFPAPHIKVAWQQLREQGWFERDSSSRREDNAISIPADGRQLSLL